MPLHSSSRGLEDLRETTIAPLALHRSRRVDLHLSPCLAVYGTLVFVGTWCFCDDCAGLPWIIVLYYHSSSKTGCRRLSS